MVAGLILGRDQQKEDIDGLAVQGSEIDAPPRQGDRSDQALKRRMPRVRDRNAHADARRAQLLAAEDRADDALDIVVGQTPATVQASDHLADRLLFTAGCRSTTIDSRATKSNSFIRPSTDGPTRRRTIEPVLQSTRPGASVNDIGHTERTLVAERRQNAATSRGDRVKGRLAAQPSSGSVSTTSSAAELLGRLGEWSAMREIAFVVLDPLLVAAKLVFDLVNTQVHRRFRGRTCFLGNKVVLVLGRDQNLDFPPVLAMVDCDFDRHQTTEVLQQFLGLFMQVSMLLGLQPTVTPRYLDLHPAAPW